MRATSYVPESPLPATVLLVGVLLFVLGAVGVAFDALPGSPVPGPGLGFDLDVELLGLATGVGAVLGDRLRRPTATTRPADVASDASRAVYVTRPLLDTLLDFAAESEPDALTVGLSVTPAGRLTGADDVPDSVPVFTHLYLPERPNSVSSVFGVDLQTPPGRIHGRFVTHPQSDLRVTKRDDLHEVVIVAVPPWDDDCVAAFDRRGRRRPLRALDAVPPDEPLPSPNQ